MLATGAPPRTARERQLESELVDLFVAEGFLHLGIAELAQRLSCSKSTLYGLASSKEQLVASVVRTFFREVTVRIESRVSDVSDPAERIQRYLNAISEELSPASEQFFLDVDRFEPAREIYHANTRIAAERVQALVREAIKGNRGQGVNPALLGTVAGQAMESIQRGEMRAITGLRDRAAYQALADLIVSGLQSRGRNR